MQELLAIKSFLESASLINRILLAVKYKVGDAIPGIMNADKSSSSAAAPMPNNASHVSDRAVNADRASIAYAARGSRA